MEEFSKHMNSIKREGLFQRNVTDLNISISSDFLSAFQWFPNKNASKSQAKKTLHTTSAEKQSCGTGPYSFLQINRGEFNRELQKTFRSWQIFTIMQHNYWPAYFPYLNRKGIKKKSIYCHFIPKYFVLSAVSRFYMTLNEHLDYFPLNHFIKSQLPNDNNQYWVDKKEEKKPPLDRKDNVNTSGCTEHQWVVQ